jgi:hypothetical protein
MDMPGTQYPKLPWEIRYTPPFRTTNNGIDESLTIGEMK